MWENPSYMSPAKYRQQLRISAKNKYVNRMQQKAHAEATRPTDSYKLTPLDDIFKGDPLKKALDLGKDDSNSKEKKMVNKPKKKKKIRKAPTTKKSKV